MNNFYLNGCQAPQQLERSPLDVGRLRWTFLKVKNVILSQLVKKGKRRGEFNAQAFSFFFFLSMVLTLF
jgi:hypothetical protein